ncbi:hypothetical protein EPN15_01410 [Patescibacteria group bacterium]|nr:MAG: hypothetical protein EPN15_01410 [Patescibacteria group bacterium]
MISLKFWRSKNKKDLSSQALISKSSRVVLIIAIVLIFFVLGIAFGFAVLKNKGGSKIDSINANNEIAPDLNVNTGDSNANEQQLSEGDIAAIFESLPTPERKTSKVIKWQTLRQISKLGIFIYQGNDYREKSAKYYKIGEFISGKYEGADLILASAPFDGPAFYPGFYRFVKKGNELFFLKKYSDEAYDMDGLDRSKFTVDDEFDIPELNYPKLLKGQKSWQYLEQDESVRALMNLSSLKISFVDAAFGNVYTTDDALRASSGDIFTKNGFYIEAPDGTARVYALKIYFINKKNVPEITWNDKTKNANEYTFSDVTGCGSRDYVSIRSSEEVSPENDFEVIGRNSKGDQIYGLKNKEHAIYHSVYDNSYFESEKMPYEQFVQLRPLFYWIDPFGRIVEFKNNKFIPPAECAKPVIYLYPEKEMGVSVKIDPKGGLTKSEPEYGNGWDVIANPSGDLIEVGTGKNYPYLFWEGRGAIYEQPIKGFVVNKENIHSFLVDKLTLLGLNEKERADFMEFWEPKMQSAPYYFVTFLGNREMDAIAPLNINPAPDTIIRVLMDFSPLNKPIKAHEYEIKTPIRNGYTAVEWGGVMR